jgi:hypothetical protein
MQWGRPMDDYSALTAWVGHSLSTTAILGSLAGLFPPIAAVAAVIWYTIQVYESRTFQHWYRNRQMVHRARKLAKLRAKEKIVLAKIEAIEKVRASRVEARELVESARADAAKILTQEQTTTTEHLPPI